MEFIEDLSGMGEGQVWWMKLGVTGIEFSG